MRLVNNTECVCDIPDLLPCPFCGSDNVDVWNGEFGIYCVDCGAIGPGAPNEAEAAKRWNSREPRERLLTKIEHLEFEKAISQKTGWGKNEIMKVFDQALATAALRLLDERKE